MKNNKQYILPIYASDNSGKLTVKIVFRKDIPQTTKKNIPPLLKKRLFALGSS